MPAPNKGVKFGCQYCKLLAMQLSICDSCLAGVCYGQCVTGVNLALAAGDLACGSGEYTGLTGIN